MTREKIEALAISLLLKQRLYGSTALYFLDLRHIVTDGKALIGSISEYEKSTGTTLPFRPEGFTLASGDTSLIFYDDKITSKERRNWTIAHELGHIYLSHSSDGKKEQNEANRFAAALLMPAEIIAFLDCSLGREISPTEMTKYFSASLTACKKRRLEINSREIISTENGNELINRLFSPKVSNIDEHISNFKDSVL